MRRAYGRTGRRPSGLRKSSVYACTVLRWAIAILKDSGLNFEDKRTQRPPTVAQMMKNAVVPIQHMEPIIERPRQHWSLAKSTLMLRQHCAVPLAVPIEPMLSSEKSFWTWNDSLHAACCRHFSFSDLML